MGIREAWNDARQLGIRESLYQQRLRGIYPEVNLLDQEGNVIRSGLLTSFDEKAYWVRSRANHGYVSGGGPIGENIKVVTKDGTEMTTELFKELVEAKAGKGYLEGRQARVDALAQSLGIPDRLRGK